MDDVTIMMRAEPSDRRVTLLSHVPPPPAPAHISCLMLHSQLNCHPAVTQSAGERVTVVREIFLILNDTHTVPINDVTSLKI